GRQRVLAGVHGLHDQPRDREQPDQGTGGLLHVAHEALPRREGPGAAVGAQVPDGERAVHVAHGQQARVGGVEGQTRGRHAAAAAVVQGGGGPRRSPAQ
ncbi:hypothetical protein CRUP_018661, partial [Coryphaenoides rupestris]